MLVCYGEEEEGEGGVYNILYLPDKTYAGDSERGEGETES